MFDLNPNSGNKCLSSFTRCSDKEMLVCDWTPSRHHEIIMVIKRVASRIILIGNPKCNEGLPISAISEANKINNWPILRCLRGGPLSIN